MSFQKASDLPRASKLHDWPCSPLKPDWFRWGSCPALLADSRLEQQESHRQQSLMRLLMACHIHKWPITDTQSLTLYITTIHSLLFCLFNNLPDTLIINYTVQLSDKLIPSELFLSNCHKKLWLPEFFFVFVFLSFFIGVDSSCLRQYCR